MKVRLVDVVFRLTLVLILLMPFHALITNQISGGGEQSILSAWKEVIVAVMGLAAGLALFTDKPLRHWLVKNRWLWVVCAYGLTNIAYVLFFESTTKAELVGLRTNLVFLAVFVFAYMSASKKKYQSVSAQLTIIISLVAVAVSAFGVFQAFFPTIVGRYVTNNSFTLQPFLFVQDAGIIRINSSLWGPSQLGSYLVLPICLALWQRLRTKRWQWSASLAVMIVALFATQSRAAWIGTIIGCFAILAWHFRTKLSRRLVLVGAAIVLVIAVTGGLFLLKTNTPLTYLVFHSRNDRALTASSNVDRVKAIGRGIETWQDNPVGSGVGTAGPASTYSKKVLYTESYYAQLLVEMGLLGLGLFLLISYMVGNQLKKVIRQKPLAIPLLAAFVGLVIMNVVHHTWSDAATAMIWWGAAGLILGSKK